MCTLQRISFKLSPSHLDGWAENVSNIYHHMFVIFILWSSSTLISITLTDLNAHVFSCEGPHWLDLSYTAISGEKDFQLIYSLFDPFKPMNTFVSTVCLFVCSGEYVCMHVSVYMCAYVLEKDRDWKKKRRVGVEGKGEGGVTQEASKATAEHRVLGIASVYVYFINILPSCQSRSDSIYSGSLPSATH